MKVILEYLKPYRLFVVLAPMFMVLEAGIELLLPKIMTKMIEYGVGNGDIGYVAKMGTTMVLLSLVGIMGGVLCLACAAKVSQTVGRDLRKDLFTKIQSFSFRNIDTFQTPSLITRLTNDITQIQMVILMSLRMLIRAPILCFGSIIMAFTIDAKMAIIFVVAFALLMLVTAVIMKQAAPRFMRVQNKLDAVNTVMRECLAGIRVVKAFMRNEYEIEKFSNANDEYKEASIGAFRLVLMIMPLMMIILNGSLVVILWVGGYAVDAGTLQVQSIIAFNTYLIQMLMAVMMLAMVFLSMSRAKVSFERVLEIFAEEVDIQNPKNPVTAEGSDGSIVFENVSFSYGENSENSILENISFTIKGGETIGILGETGSGKSTLVNLIPRLYDVTAGRILVDGIDVKNQTLEELRKKVSVVLQETILFSGSIRSNIKWGNPDATDEEMYEAAKAAKAHEFIMGFPEGYDTHLGQRGVNVSGGQKQRISIARALLQKPEIIIFDDSTSAVDAITEKNIRDSLQTAHKNTTKIIIAQRIASVKDADQIIVLKDGKINAIGCHNVLMSTSEEYQAIFDSQTKKGVIFHE
ncbi:ABC transporter ATP-binding protein [Chakrabartyella piscis]|uniref:ABC transporter ATP-binding protein n=1 Tax=Chakrabartyella piscis TaxID=2918914 RepID=UPI002958C943|nr:ABC transporter ATP-binding protein [Chakrabartyella piscis]